MEPASVLSPTYRWTTIGMVALILIVAFEALAVTTVMPLIAAALDGADLYALAFGGPLAVSVIGMVIAGNWSDRSGPAPALLVSVAVFLLGLVVAGAAQSMEILVLGRLLHGLGGGGINVALYVMVARAFPPRLHPAIFAGFAAAWVLPSLVGPLIGGIVAEQFGWRWVFFGVVFLCLPALLAMGPALRRLRAAQIRGPVPWSPSRFLAAVIVCTGVLAMDLAATLGTTPGWVGAAAAGIITIVAIGHLLPRGTRTLTPGLPSVIAMRGILSGAFISAEVYLPYLLTGSYHVTPALTGASLTIGGVAWSIASQVHSRVSTRLSARRILLIGAGLLSVATLLVLLTTAIGAGPAPTVACWAIAGAGMGFSYPRLGTMTLALSTPDRSGFNSAALSISDSIGAALALTLAGIAFTGLGGPNDLSGFLAAFAFAALLALAAIGVGWRASAVVEPRPIP